ncbi:peptidase family C54 [Beauveria bassiana ARSEF 2860]|uniref:Cysteine protease n=1 Tax=Beauveria bassiana (strain ARSEF 2860) TaxID=655819 RepID=J4VR22_BEAB2|nr:peptidase family C54 [Beauveria bassiana ARSEF 2860]EJP61110.1 peptidase family C54 [Beauveria bassiana ARSEF 2860]
MTMESTMAHVDLGRYKKIVQMFWDPEPSNDPTLDQPVWCLGQSYKLHKGVKPRTGSQGQHSSDMGATTATASLEPSKAVAVPPNNAPDTPPESIGGSFSTGRDEMDHENGWPQQFITDFDSRFWMTYRNDFKPIPRSKDPKAASSMSFPMRIKYQLGDQGGFSSDSGWGCMIRSGQSLLANATGIVRLGRDWRRGQQKAEEIKIMRMFADDPAAPYSIHNFVDYGSSKCGKYPGEWFGPSATSQCINPDVYEDSFMATAKSDHGFFKPTLILISTRLGIDKITQVYWEALISALQMPQSVGIAGLRRLHVQQMDPSMLIGFIIRSEEEWKEWRCGIKYVQGKAIIHVADCDPRLQNKPEGREGAIDEVQVLSDDDMED